MCRGGEGVNERWRYIKGYNKKYAISNQGRVKSFHQNIIMKQQIVNGLKRVSLTDGNNYTHLYIHHLVAKHFIKNTNNYRVVRHIDNNILNNDVSNLEWAEYYEVQNHDRVEYTRKTFYMYDLNGKLLKEFSNIQRGIEYLQSIGHEKANHTGIKKACVGDIKTYKGFVWKFKINEQQNSDVIIDKIKEIILSNEPSVVKLIKIDKILFKGFEL